MIEDRKHTPPEKDLHPGIFTAATDGLIVIDLGSGRIVEANPAACSMHGVNRTDFIGSLPTAFVHADSQKTFTKNLQAAHSGAPVNLCLVHIRQDGSTFPTEWAGRAFTYQGRTCFLGVVRDVSPRILAERQLRQRIRARSREQSMLLEISHTLASTLDLKPDTILEQMGGIIEYRYAVLFGLSTSTLTTLAIRGPQPLRKMAPFQFRLESPGVLSALYNNHRPIRIPDINSADPQAVFLRSLLSGGGTRFTDGVRAWLWVPLAVKGRIIGGLGIANARRNFFTARHAALALSIADQVAITMVNAELVEHARALATLQERQRLAQNLHDAVNQSLFSAGLIAEVLPRLWDRDPIEARRSLEDLRHLTRGALAEMRELLAELQPSVLTDSSLGDLLRQLANAFTGRTNVPVSLSVSGEHVLSEELQLSLYRICQEALNNIAKHAGAHQVEIDLKYIAGTTQSSSSLAPTGVPQVVVVTSVDLHIRDDGQGFEPGQSANSGHYGLGMMKARAEAVGARLMVTSLPGQGTEVLLHWPGHPEQESQ